MTNVLKRIASFTLIFLFASVAIACGSNNTDTTQGNIVQAEKITITGIGIINKSLTMVAGNETTLSAIVSPSDASNKQITWSSSNTNVATVDNNGKISALSEGNSTISATNGEITENLTLIVIGEVVLTSIEFEQSALSINIGTQRQLTIIYNPTNANAVSLFYSIAPVGDANPSLASVSATGLVSISSDAVADSQYIVTAMVLTDSSIYAQCTITVNEVELTGLSLKKNNEAIALSTSSSNRLGIPLNLMSNVFSLVPLYTPSNTTQIDVEYSSSDETVMTIDEYGIYSVAPTAEVGDTCELTVTGANSIVSTVYIIITESTNYVYQLFNASYFNGLATDLRTDWDIEQYGTDGMTSDSGDDFYDTAGNIPLTQALWRGGKTTSTYGGVAPWDGVWGVIFDSWDHPYHDDEVANQYMYNKVAVGTDINILKMRVRSHITQNTSDRAKFRVGVISIDGSGNYSQPTYLNLLQGKVEETKDTWMIISNSTVADYEAGNDYYYFDISAYKGQTVIIFFEVDDMHDDNLAIGEMDSLLCDRVAFLGAWLRSDISEE